MAFARVLWRGKFKDVSLVQFMVFAELVTKKGALPFAFVLYRYTAWHDEPAGDLSEMVYFELKDAEWDWLLRGTVGKERNFPDCESVKWKKTTPWLYSVTVESMSLDGYVKVSHRPRPRRKKPVRVAKSFRILPPEPILTREERELRFLEEQKAVFESQCAALRKREGSRVLIPQENRAKHAYLMRRIEELDWRMRGVILKWHSIDPRFLKPPPRIPVKTRLVLVSP